MYDNIVAQAVDSFLRCWNNPSKMAELSCKRLYPLLLVCGFLLLSRFARLSAVEESEGGATSPDGGEGRPLVFLGVLARNQEHTLPNYLGYIERLDYPKDRISVW